MTQKAAKSTCAYCMCNFCCRCLRLKPKKKTENLAKTFRLNAYVVNHSLLLLLLLPLSCCFSFPLPNQNF